MKILKPFLLSTLVLAATDTPALAATDALAPAAIDTLALAATDTLALKSEFAFRFVVGHPTGAFGEAVEDPGFGLAVDFGARLRPALTLGLGLDVLNYGRESRRVQLPLVKDVDLTTINVLAGGSLFAQWRPLRAVVQPYAEARLGLNYIWTESYLEAEVEVDDGWETENFAREVNYDDWAGYWGVGGGLLIRLRDGDQGDGKAGVYLDLKVNFLQGANAEYLTEGDITLVNDRPVFNASRSETDLTTYELGVVVTFVPPE